MCAQKRTISICCTLDKYLCSIKIEPNLYFSLSAIAGPILDNFPAGPWTNRYWHTRTAAILVRSLQRAPRCTGRDEHSPRREMLRLPFAMA